MSHDETIAPKVFISYSHDSLEHADHVLEFSDRLRLDGIDCILDQYEEAPAEGFPRWMDRQIQNADFVLMICTSTYSRRVMGDEEPGIGLGVQWESNLIYQYIYNAGASNKRFIPVLLEGASPSDIPAPWQGAKHYRPSTEAGYNELYRRLTNQPETPKPELGTLRKMPPRERKHNFLASKSEQHPKDEQVPLIKDITSQSTSLAKFAILEAQEKLEERTQSDGQQYHLFTHINKCYTNIIAAKKVTRDVRKVFARQKLYPDECIRALSTLEIINKPVQELDKLIEHHASIFGKKRSELLTTLHLLEAQLSDLGVLKKSFCLVCQKAPMEQRENIQQKIEEILINICKMDRLMKSFNKLADLSEIEDQLSRAKPSDSKGRSQPLTATPVVLIPEETLKENTESA